MSSCFRGHTPWPPFIFRSAFRGLRLQGVEYLARTARASLYPAVRARPSKVGGKKDPKGPKELLNPKALQSVSQLDALRRPGPLHAPTAATFSQLRLGLRFYASRRFHVATVGLQWHDLRTGSEIIASQMASQRQVSFATSHTKRYGTRCSTKNCAFLAPP